MLDCVASKLQPFLTSIFWTKAESNSFLVPFLAFHSSSCFKSLMPSPSSTRQYIYRLASKHNWTGRDNDTAFVIWTLQWVHSNCDIFFGNSAADPMRQACNSHIWWPRMSNFEAQYTRWWFITDITQITLQPARNICGCVCPLTFAPMDDASIQSVL